MLVLEVGENWTACSWIWGICLFYYSPWTLKNLDCPANKHHVVIIIIIKKILNKKVIILLKQYCLHMIILGVSKSGKMLKFSERRLVFELLHICEILIWITYLPLKKSIVSVWNERLLFML